MPNPEPNRPIPMPPALRMLHEAEDRVVELERELLQMGVNVDKLRPLNLSRLARLFTRLDQAITVVDRLRYADGEEVDLWAVEEAVNPWSMDEDEDEEDEEDEEEVEMQDEDPGVVPVKEEEVKEEEPVAPSVAHHRSGKKAASHDTEAQEAPVAGPTDPAIKQEQLIESMRIPAKTVITLGVCRASRAIVATRAWIEDNGPGPVPQSLTDIERALGFIESVYGPFDEPGRKKGDSGSGPTPGH